MDALVGTLRPLSVAIKLAALFVFLARLLYAPSPEDSLVSAVHAAQRTPGLTIV